MPRRSGARPDFPAPAAVTWEVSPTVRGRPTHPSYAPEALFAVGAVSQYLGAAVAATLFRHLAPSGVAFLRVLGAAVIVMVVRSPWRRRWSVGELARVAAFGVSLAAMNLCFYLAMHDLPLGNAVAIEFIGPMAVAAFGARTPRSAGALALAVAGVVALAGVEAGGTARGVVFALAAGGFWAGYILLGHRVARGPASVDGLGLGMLAGALVISPFGVPDVLAVWGSPSVLAFGLLTGLLSNAVPYRIDQTVMRRVDPRRFALLQALLPVTATLVGLVALGQVPGGRALTGIALVVGAIVLNRRR